MSSTVNISLNMGMPVPIPTQDPGPDWAQNLYASLYNVVDQHDHSPGKGVQVTPAGLNINAPLTFQTQSAINLLSAGFISQASPLSIASFPGSLYVSGGNLYFNSPSTQIQLTTPTNINATSSGITSGTATASFVSNVLVVNQAPNTPANIQAGSLLMGNNTVGSPFLTLQPPTLSSSYALTLPTIPASTSFVTLDNGGNLAGNITTAGGITNTNIANTTITSSKLAASLTFTGPLSTTPLTNTTATLIGSATLTGSLSTRTNLVQIQAMAGLQGDIKLTNSGGTTLGLPILLIQIFRDATLVATYPLAVVTIGPTGGGNVMVWNCNTITHIDTTPTTGNPLYNITAFLSTNPGGALTVNFENCQIAVTQL